jgi:hypothetical protein
LAATLVSGSAFAVPGSVAKGLEAPATSVKVSCGCHRPHYHCGSACSGYYSLYTYVAPCYGGCACGGCACAGCGHGGYTWTCGGFFGGIFGW